MNGKIVNINENREKIISDGMKRLVELIEEGEFQQVKQNPNLFCGNYTTS